MARWGIVVSLLVMAPCLTTCKDECGDPSGDSGVETVCVPDCTDRACGADGCGGGCGDCPGDQVCRDGECRPCPDCDGRVCGSDGCGGSCGLCPEAGQVCNLGQCQDCLDEFEPDDQPETASPLEVGTEGTHAICPRNEADWLWFCLDDPHKVEIRIQTTGGEVKAELFRADCGKETGTADDLFQAPCLGDRNPSWDDLTFPMDCKEVWDSDKSGFGNLFMDANLGSGKFLLRVRARDAAETVDEYKVQFEVLCEPDCDGKECGDDGCEGTCGDCDAGFLCEDGTCVADCTEDPFEPDDTTEGPSVEPGAPALERSICPVGDLDHFGFSLSAHSDVVVEITTEEVDLEAWLYDVSKNILDHDDSEGSISLVLTDTEVPPGDYQVVVRADHDGDVVPAYWIEVNATCAPQCDGKECGGDGCGDTCGECEPGFDCSDGECVESRG